MWQNKLNDLLWLELRAWHNGRSLQLEDQVLCTERERIGIVLNEIMNFKFVSTAGVSTCRCGSASSFSSQSNMREEAVDDVSSSEVICEYPGSPLLNKQTSRLHSVSKRKLGISIPSPCNEISNQDDHMVNDNGDLTFGFNPAVECCGLCSIYCQYCINNQNEALRQVKHLLDQLDTVESLYPSSRAMKKAWEFYTTSELESRVRTLCLYYNLVTDLRQKISTLGKMLSSLGGKNLKWPYFHSSFETDNDLKNDKQANEPASDVSMMIQTDSEISFNIEDDFGDVETPSISYFGRERKFSKSVRFENTEDTLVRPSLESPVECSSTNDIPLITKLSSSTPNDSPDLTPTPTKEFNFSTSLYMYSVKEADEHSVVSPYRSFVDKFLKQKGLRKLLQRLMELVQNTLCRAKFALEKKSDIASTKSPDLQVSYNF